MYSPVQTLGGIAISFLSFIATSPSLNAQTQPPQDSKINAPGLSTISARSDRYQIFPSNSICIASIDAAKLQLQPEFELIPWEVLLALSLEMEGIEMKSIDTIDIAIGEIAPVPEFGIAIHFTKPFAIEKIRGEFVSPIQNVRNNSKLRFREVSHPKFPNFKILQSEPTIILAGTNKFLQSMIVGASVPKDGAFAVLQESTGLVRVAIEFEKIKKIILNYLESSENQVPFEIVGNIIHLVKHLENSLIDVSDLSLDKVKWSFGVSKQDDVAEIAQALTYLRENALTLAEKFQREAIRDNSASLSVEVISNRSIFVNRVAEYLRNQELYSIETNRVVIKPSFLKSLVAASWYSSLLIPILQKSKATVQRRASIQKLGEIHSALLNYEYQLREFPPRVIRDESGKPLLSWRVAILPLLGKQELFEKFHFDEPWDSPHNIQLVDQMPECYRSAQYPADGFRTNFLMPYGKSSNNGEGPASLQDVTDGARNTISLVEVDAPSAVVWTQPEDLDFEEKNLERHFNKKGFNIILYDNSTRVMNWAAQEETIRAAFTFAGNEDPALYAPKRLGYP